MKNYQIAVIPAKAEIYVDFEFKPKMDSRFRGNDGNLMIFHVLNRLFLIAFQ